MRHNNKNKILSRKAPLRKALIRDLVTAMVTHERIETPFVRAKVARQQLEKLITVAKNPTLQARRRLLAFFTTDQPVKKMLEVIGPRYAERKGGYTRIIKMGHRLGDAAETAIIEFV
jgi:large subunit ribosomal protein L17